MLTRKQCIAKVAEMELQAIIFPYYRDDYIQLAEQWQWIADHAEWQEAYEDRFI